MGLACDLVALQTKKWKNAGREYGEDIQEAIEGTRAHRSILWTSRQCETGCNVRRECCQWPLRVGGDNHEASEVTCSSRLVCKLPSNRDHSTPDACAWDRCGEGRKEEHQEGRKNHHWTLKEVLVWARTCAYVAFYISARIEVEIFHQCCKSSTRKDQLFTLRYVRWEGCHTRFKLQIITILWFFHAPSKWITQPGGRACINEGPFFAALYAPCAKKKTRLKECVHPWISCLKTSKTSIGSDRHPEIRKSVFLCPNLKLLKKIQPNATGFQILVDCESHFINHGRMAACDKCSGAILRLAKVSNNRLNVTVTFHEFDMTEFGGYHL